MNLPSWVNVEAPSRTVLIDDLRPQVASVGASLSDQRRVPFGVDAVLGRKRTKLRAIRPSPSDANVGSLMSFAGLLIIIGIIGLFRARSFDSPVV